MGFWMPLIRGILRWDTILEVQFNLLIWVPHWVRRRFYLGSIFCPLNLLLNEKIRFFSNNI